MALSQAQLDLIAQRRADARHLQQLTQLRRGKRPDDVVRVQRPVPQADGATRTEIFYAHDGQFRDVGCGRWEYIDELGHNWSGPAHQRIKDQTGMPYGHVVLVERPTTVNRQQAAEQGFREGHLSAPDPQLIPDTHTEISYVRKPLKAPVLDDRSSRSQGIDVGRLSPQQVQDLAAGRPVAPTRAQSRQPSQRTQSAAPQRNRQRPER